MAAFLGHPPPVLSHPILPPRTLNFSSSPSPPPQLPLQQPTLPQLLEASSSPGQHGAASLPQKYVAKASVESTDWIATSLTRRFGLAWAGCLAIGVLSQQIKTRLEVSHQEANTRNMEKEEVVLPSGIRYYELRVGGGASPRPGDLVVIHLKGKIQENSEVFIDTFNADKKSLALVMGSRPCSKGVCEGIEYALGSRPYSKGVCEGIEYALRSMKVGGKRRVIVPPNLGFGEKGTDLGTGVQIPPSASLEYIVEVDKVSIAAA